MAWTYLLIAGLLEIGWAVGLKTTDGFTRLWPSIAAIPIMFVGCHALTALHGTQRTA
jgi:quaternary ammonium compound-resistance protein SugE